jgi:hypothetical protein
MQEHSQISAEAIVDAHKPKKNEPHIMIAFWLALVLEVIPVEGGLLAPLIWRGFIGPAILAKIFVLTLIIVPLVRGVIRLRLDATQYKGCGFAVATIGILVMNLFFTGQLLLQIKR